MCILLMHRLISRSSPARLYNQTSLQQKNRSPVHDYGDFWEREEDGKIFPIADLSSAFRAERSSGAEGRSFVGTGEEDGHHLVSG